MNLKALFGVLKSNVGKYVLWLGSIMGGLILSFLAAFTIWLFHRHSGNMLPKSEAYLLTGVISLMITGLSYINNKKKNETYMLSPTLSIIWGFFLLLVYGALITIGATKPAIGEKSILLIAVILFICCMLWSSIIWAHERGFEMDAKKAVEAPGLSKDLIDAAKDLPKMNEDHNA